MEEKSLYEYEKGEVVRRLKGGWQLGMDYHMPKDEVPFWVENGEWGCGNELYAFSYQTMERLIKEGLIHKIAGVYPLVIFGLIGAGGENGAA